MSPQLTATLVTVNCLGELTPLFRFATHKRNKTVGEVQTNRDDTSGCPYLWDC